MSNRPQLVRLFALLLAIAPGALVAMASCGEGPEGADAGTADGARPDSAAPLDAASPDDATTSPDAAVPSDAAHPADAGAPDASAGVDGGAGADAGPYGFAIRIPQERTIPLLNTVPPGGTTTAWDIDYVCTFRYAAFDGFFYLQSTPVEARSMGSAEHRTEGGWLSFAGVVTSAAGALYDYGGNHHNDSMDLDYQGKRLRYFHSTLGSGFRSCMPPDCLQVYQGTTLLDDGCEPDRRLPVACVLVAHDGTVAPLIDNYKKCPGDPNAFDAGL